MISVGHLPSYRGPCQAEAISQKFPTSDYMKDAVETTLLITADQVKINFLFTITATFVAILKLGSLNNHLSYCSQIFTTISLFCMNLCRPFSGAVSSLWTTDCLDQISPFVIGRKINLSSGKLFSRPHHLKTLQLSPSLENLNLNYASLHCILHDCTIALLHVLFSFYIFCFLISCHKDFFSYW